MNTYTILNIKMDKKLKLEAKRVSDELGVPLSTVVNAFLKQFVRDKEITISASEYRPTAYLKRVIADAQMEYDTGGVKKYMNADEFLAAINNA